MRGKQIGEFPRDGIGLVAAACAYDERVEIRLAPIALVESDAHRHARGFRGGEVAHPGESPCRKQIGMLFGAESIVPKLGAIARSRDIAAPISVNSRSFD
jgi:hypothetical protein